LTALSTGAWTDVSCYTALDDNGTAAGFAGCANEYGLLRALWDDATIPASTLTEGGLTATKIPDLLHAYQSEIDEEWKKFEEKIEGYGYDLDTFQDIFCSDDLSELLDIEKIYENLDELEENDPEFVELDIITWMRTILGFDVEDSPFTSMDPGSSKWEKYYWLTAICPGNGVEGLKDIMVGWFNLFTELGENPKCEDKQAGKCVRCIQGWTNLPDCNKPCNLSKESEDCLTC